MASSSSSLPKPITSPTTSPTAVTRKPQPIPWTHQETVNLITAYQEKWYSLKRGPLRGSQWEEVAVIVAARCGYHFNYPSKSALQCRHKMEKLRQRHRSEKHRLAAGSSASSRSWQYFRLMDDLERGPQPISVRPVPLHHDEYNDDDGCDDDGDGDDEFEKVNSSVKSRTRSINYILSQRPRTTTREDEVDDDDDDDEVDEEEEVIVKEKGLVSGLTAEIRGFAERIIGMENLKMEMMKETERFRLEMENKRIRLILDSQSRIVDSIQRAFGSS